MAKAAINKDNALFTSELDFTSREKLVKCYIWSIALYGAKKLDTSESIPEISGKVEMLCWRRMEKMNWIDRVENEEILQSQSREEYPTNKTQEG